MDSAPFTVSGRLNHPAGERPPSPAQPRLIAVASSSARALRVIASGPWASRTETLPHRARQRATTVHATASVCAPPSGLLTQTHGRNSRQANGLAAAYPPVRGPWAVQRFGVRWRVERRALRSSRQARLFQPTSAGHGSDSSRHVPKPWRWLRLRASTWRLPRPFARARAWRLDLLSRAASSLD